MAYYQALLEGERSFEATAWEQLNQQRASIANDKQALDALGNLSAERGEQGLAEQSFKRVLSLDPIDLTALSNLGTLLAKQGKLSEAIPLLRSAFDRNRDIPGLAMNLARVQCMAGDSAAARGTLSTALLYSPGEKDMQRLLAQLSTCGAPGER
jgi:Flp pilus assembly protein TadD